MYREQYGDYVYCYKSLFKGLKPKEGGREQCTSNSLHPLPLPLLVPLNKWQNDWSECIFSFTVNDESSWQCQWLLALVIKSDITQAFLLYHYLLLDYVDKQNGSLF